MSKSASDFLRVRSRQSSECACMQGKQCIEMEVLNVYSGLVLKRGSGEGTHYELVVAPVVLNYS